MSEPQHINEILPRVLRSIKGRCNLYRRKHGLPLLREGQKRKDDYQGKALSAVFDVGDVMSCRTWQGRKE